MEIKGKITKRPDIVDATPYILFKKMRTTHPTSRILITPQDLSIPGLRLGYSNHRDYIDKKFKEQGVEVTRWAHNYNTLSGTKPELGLVYLANDSHITPGVEVWALIGHNAKYIGGTNG